MKMTKKEYQNIIGNDIGLVNRYIPNGLGKTHIIETLNNSVEMHYPSERQTTTEHKQKVEKEALYIPVVSGNALWKEKQSKNFCRNKECPFYNGWSYGCKQNSDASKCAARDFY